ncbi:MAG TPA: hypothetical protein VKG25_23485 [Bryobacteraceae bacterium]|nr:hypothetical protein [Bryobacteraceae bacterium]
MALERAFQLLGEQLRVLKEAVDELQLNVSGDYHPESQSQQRIDGDSGREQAPLPVQRLADAVSELEGAIEEAQHAAAGAERAVRYPRRLLETQLALIVIQRCMNGALKTFLEDVSAYEAMQTLIVMGRRKGGKWPEWVALVKTVIEACRAPLYETFQALFECWQELADKLSAKAISLQTTNIGQQITTRENQEKAAHEFT